MEGDLKVWWIPQVPMCAFEVPVSSIVDGKLLLDTLAAYDQFQLDNNVKPDYSNAGGLSVEEDGEWVDWNPTPQQQSEHDCNDIDGVTLEELRSLRWVTEKRK